MRHPRRFIRAAIALTLLTSASGFAQDLPYPILDTGQSRIYGAAGQLTRAPAEGERFFGQDGQYAGTPFDYELIGSDVALDRVTGLYWTRDPGEQVTYPQARAGAARCRAGGYDDWRLPTVKELYSLINFNGSVLRDRPYIDTDVFAFEYGDADGGRVIDAQYWTANEYVGRLGQLAGVFGVNFADGRIKCYPRDRGPRGDSAVHYVLYVRGNEDYGRNDFVDNGDGTVTDRATALMWTQADSGRGMTWEEALAWCEQLNAAGHDDWRLPNPKELQSIVDYSRSPGATDPAARGPAIDPVFDVTEDESWYWTSTTHLDNPRNDQAVYVCFGRGLSEWTDPTGQRIDIHGAGCQRSDPKSGDPADFAAGRGPQGDQVRIYNYVRAVRNVEPNAVELVAPDLTADTPAQLPEGMGNGADGLFGPAGQPQGPPQRHRPDGDSRRLPPPPRRR